MTIWQWERAVHFEVAVTWNMCPSSWARAATAFSGIMYVMKAKPLVFLVKLSIGKCTSDKGPLKKQNRNTHQKGPFFCRSSYSFSSDHVWQTALWAPPPCRCMEGFWWTVGLTLQHPPPLHLLSGSWWSSGPPLCPVCLSCLYLQSCPRGRPQCTGHLQPGGLQDKPLFTIYSTTDYHIYEGRMKEVEKKSEMFTSVSFTRPSHVPSL